jgi:hypothetical protein
MNVRVALLVLSVTLYSSTACIPRPVMEGHAYLKGVADSSGIIIGTSYRNSYSDEVVTGKDGSYEVNGAIGGGNLITITAYAQSTVEKQLEIMMIDNGDRAYVSDFNFTPIGSLHGRVTSGGTGVGGVEVGAEGISVSAITDDNGEYTLIGAPVGTYTLAALPPGKAVVELAGQPVVYKTTSEAADIVIN